MVTSIAIATLFMFLGPKNIFLQFFHLKLLHGLELISFSTLFATSVALATLYSVSWTYKFQECSTDWSGLGFWQHLATSVTMATLFSVSCT